MTGPRTDTGLREAAFLLVTATDNLDHWDRSHGYIINSERDYLDRVVSEAWDALLAALAIPEEERGIDATAAREDAVDAAWEALSAALDIWAGMPPDRREWLGYLLARHRPLIEAALGVSRG